MSEGMAMRCLNLSLPPMYFCVLILTLSGSSIHTWLMLCYTLTLNKCHQGLPVHYPISSPSSADTPCPCRMNSRDCYIMWWCQHHHDITCPPRCGVKFSAGLGWMSSHLAVTPSSAGDRCNLGGLSPWSPVAGSPSVQVSLQWPLHLSLETLTAPPLAC